MEFVNEFTVPTDIETAFKLLADLEQVAPCLPGATLEEVEGSSYTGRVKVKVGPITITYRGTAQVVETDADARTLRIEARGRETRGAGTASADVAATLSETEGGTLVHVVTDLAVTGKPAQFGRGVMSEVGTKIIDEFAQRLEAMVTGDGVDGAPAAASTSGTQDTSSASTAAAQDTPSSSADAAKDTSAASTDATPTGVGETATATAGSSEDPRRIAPDASREQDTLDLVEFAGGAAARRAVPAVVAVAAIAALIWWLVRR